MNHAFRISPLLITPTSPLRSQAAILIFRYAGFRLLERNPNLNPKGLYEAAVKLACHLFHPQLL